MGTDHFTLIYKDHDGYSNIYRTTVFNMPFPIPDGNTAPCLDLLKRIASDYAATEDGKAVLTANNNKFTWNDFAEIPESFLNNYNVHILPYDTGFAEIVKADEPIPIKRKSELGLKTDKKYIMLLSVPGNSPKEYYNYHPEEGLLRDIRYGDNFEELMDGNDYTGYLYQMYDAATGERVASGIVRNNCP